MPRPDRSGLRWLRALVLAAVALVTGSVAHLSAGGLLPGPAGLALLLLLGTTVAAPALRRPASTRRVVVLLVAGQTAVHVLLTAASGHHEDAEPALHGPALWWHHVAEDLTAAHAAMALAHAAAAALVGLWLARGEHALWLLLTLAADALVVLVRTPPVLAVLRRPRVVPVDQRLLPPPALVSADCLRRRGPPQPCAS